MIEEALRVCLLLLKNEDKARAFRTPRGKIGDFKSHESENDKPLVSASSIWISDQLDVQWHSHYEERKRPMSAVTLTASLKNRPVISITNGEILAKVDTVLINPNTRAVAALRFTQGGLLNRETRLIPAEEIRVWGEDVILVSGPDVLVPKENVSGYEDYLSVSDQLKGREVVSQDGKRIGILNDVLIDNQGQLVGYDLSKVFVEGTLAENKRINIEATHALGPDVLVVDQTLLPE